MTYPLIKCINQVIILPPPHFILAIILLVAPAKSFANVVIGTDRSELGVPIDGDSSNAPFFAPFIPSEFSPHPEEGVDVLPEGGKLTKQPRYFDETKRIDEDTPYTFGAGDFGYSAGILEAITITAVSGRGSLTNDGTAITSTSDDIRIEKADIEAGKLIFTPVENEHGTNYGRFTYNAHVAGDRVDDLNFQFNVRKVNDPPTGSLTMSSYLNDELEPGGRLVTSFFYTDDDTGFQDPDGIEVARGNFQPAGFEVEVTWIAEDENGEEVEREFPHPLGDGTVTRIGMSAARPYYEIRDEDKGARIKAKVFYRDDDEHDNEIESEWSDRIPSASAPAKLTNDDVETSNITSSSFTVSWTALEDDGGSEITRYDIQRSNHERDFSFTEEDPIPIDPSSELTHTFTELFPETSYGFQIRAVNAIGEGGWWKTRASTRITTLPATAPDAPTNLVVDETESDQLTLTWEAPVETGGKDITGYEVQHKLATDTDWPSSSTTVTTTTATISGLDPETQYDVRVAAINEIGTGSWLESSGTTAEAPVVAPQAPTDVMVAVASGTSLDVSWVAPTENGGAEITGYSVQYRDGSVSPIAWTSVTPNVTGTETTITELTTGTEYFIQVAAINSAGTGTYSGEESGTPAAAPGAPTNLTITVASATSLTATWEAPEDNGSPITGYDVRHRVSDTGGGTSGDWTSPVQIDGAVTTTTISSLTAGTGYDVEVLARNAIGDGAPAQASGTPVAAPDSPTEVTVTATTSSSLTVTWTAPTETNGADISGYNVEYRRAADAGQTAGDWIDASHSGTAETITLSSLDPYVLYDIQVAAVNQVGPSDFATGSGRTDAALPSVPQNLQVSAVSQTELDVSWGAPSENGGAPITGYEVSYRKVENPPAAWSTPNAVGPVFIHTITGLEVETIYEVQVTATNLAGTGDPATSSEVATNPIVLASAPTGATVSAPTHSSLTLEWSAPQSDGGGTITGYTVGHKLTTSSTYETQQVTGTTVVLRSLLPATTYDISIQATNEKGEGVAATLTGTTGPAVEPTVPRSLTASATSPTEISISWQAPEDDGGATVLGYNVRYRPSGSTTPPVRIDQLITTTSISITGLSGGTAYELEVAAINTVGTGLYAQTTESTNAAIAPTAPRNIRVTAQEQNALTVAWSAPSSDGGAPITGHEVRYRVEASQDWISVTPAGNTAEMTGLLAGTSYVVGVSAVNSAGTGQEATETFSTTAANVPSAPQNLEVQVTGPNSLSVSWEAPAQIGGSPISNYLVEYRLTDAPASTAWSNATSSGTTTTATITDLLAGTSYDVRVAARNVAGSGGFVSQTVTTTSSAPGIPTSLQITSPSPTELTVSWEAPEITGGEPILLYKLRYRLTDSDITTPGVQPGDWEPVIEIESAASLQRTLTQLSAGTSYDVQIAANNSIGDGEYSSNTVGVTNPATVPTSPPDGFEVLSISHTGAELAWTEFSSDENGGSAVTGYRVGYRLADADGSGPGTAPGDWEFSDHTTTNATLTDLVAETVYNVQVAAVNSVGEGPFASQTFTTLNIGVTSVPLDLAITVISSSELSVTWSPPTETSGSAVTGYSIQYRTSATDTEEAGPWIAVEQTGTETSAFVEGLTGGTSYDVQVAAINSAGIGPYTEASATTSIAVPNQPLDLSVRATSPSRILVTWSAPDQNNSGVSLSYIVEYRTSDPDGEGAEPAGDWEQLSTTETTFELTDLLSNTSYDVRVAAENSAGQGEYTEIEIATTTSETSRPGMPSNVVLTSLSPTEVRVTWVRPDETGGLALRSYTIEYIPVNAPADSDPMTLTRRAGTTEVILTGLMVGTEYQVHIAAVNALGAGEFETGTVTTESATAPSPPRALIITGTSTTDLEVSWTAPVDEGGIPILRYRIDYRVSDEDEIQTGRQPGDWEEESSESTTVLIQNLASGTSYDVRVAAINADFTGSFVQSIGQTMDETGLPDAPSSLTLTVLSTSSIQASWTVPSSGPDVTGYRVEYRGDESSGTWQQIAHTGLSTEVTITDLMAGTTYQVRVAGLIEAEHGEFVQESATTQATPPSVPENLVVCGSSDDALRLSWDAPFDNGGAPITSYEIGYRTGINSWTTWTREETGLQETISGLSASTLYEVRVAAMNRTGKGSYTNGSAATQTSTQPNAPLTLTVCGQSTTELDVFWATSLSGSGKASQGSSSASTDVYELYYKELSASEWEQVPNLTNEGYARIYDLSPGIVYDVELFHLVDNTETVYAGAASTQDATIPSSPLDFLIQSASDSELELSWQSPERDGGVEILRYEVRHRESDGDRELEGFQPGEWVENNYTSNEVTLSELLSGTSYEVQIAATNEIGTGPYATLSATTSPSAELEEDWLALKNIYEETEGVRWTAQENWSIADSELPQIQELNAWSGVEVYRGRVTELNLSGVGMLGTLPETVGNLTGLIEFRIDQNNLEGTLPGEMTNIENLEILHFDGQSLCAPIYDEFQDWLQTVSEVMGSNCQDAFTLTGTIQDQIYTVSQPIEQLNLPEASGGQSPYVYTLSPELPPGLMFDALGPHISGTPQEPSVPTMYTYTATDNIGTVVSTDFTIEVMGTTSLEAGHTVTEFVLLGNYPNPFNPSTNILVDLPTAADLSVEVFNLLGQRVHVEEFFGVSAGPSKSLMLAVPNLPSGVYIYRVIANLDAGAQLAKGRMTLMK